MTRIFLDVPVPLRVKMTTLISRQEKITDLVRTKLQETGDLERLRCYVRRRLISSGWKTEVQKELRACINEVEYQTLTVEEIYNKVVKSGINIDQRFKEEAFRKIRHCYKEALKKEILDGEKKVTSGMKNNVTRKHFNVKGNR